MVQNLRTFIQIAFTTGNMKPDLQTENSVSAVRFAWSIITRTPVSVIPRR